MINCCRIIFAREQIGGAAIRCSNCGEKLIKGAKFCDICGTPCPTPEHQEYLRKKARRKWIILIVAGCVVLAIVGAFFGWLKWLEHDSDRITEENSLADVEARVTPEEFEKIQMDMTLEEVENIIGGKGKVMYESEYSIEYGWPGEYYIDEPFDYRIDATFRKEDNTLSSLDENNVVFGKQAREYDEIMKKRDYSALDVPIVKKNQLNRLEEGMSYSEVASILGGDGSKISERRYINSRGSADYREIEESVHSSYVWKCIRRRNGEEWIVILGFDDGELSLSTDALQELMIE